MLSSLFSVILICTVHCVLADPHEAAHLQQNQLPLRTDKQSAEQAANPHQELSDFAYPGLENKYAQQASISLAKLLANISPGGSQCPDATPGTVIASPSKSHPDYYYQWTRDSAITMGDLVNHYTDHPTNASTTPENIIAILEAYASLSKRIQHTSNPSGSFDDGLKGLGEPKFLVDGSPFTEDWGRPQRDGPALRAMTLMKYIKAYNASHPDLWIPGTNPFTDLYESTLPANSTIKADLEYVSRYWMEKGFDLWEEVDGVHFFTAMVQWRALVDGAELARELGDDGAAAWYERQAGEIRELLHGFWDEGKGHIISTRDTDRTGLDCSIMIGSLLAHPDSENEQQHEQESDTPFPPYSDEILISLLHLTRDNANRYPINAELGPHNDSFIAVGLGRYPEDIYDGYATSPDGGNPWFLCTTNAAEVLFRAAKQITRAGRLRITPRGAPFWTALLPDMAFEIEDCVTDAERIDPNSDSTSKPCTFNNSSPVFMHAIAALGLRGDDFLDIVERHADSDGSLSEQFNRETGYQQGALSLTWSYGAFLSAVRARSKLLGMV